MRSSSKRGDTFSEDYEVANPDGSPADFTGWDIAAMFRMGNRAITLTAEPLSGNVVRLSAPSSETRTWKPGRWEGDIEFSRNGEVYSTATFQHLVIADVTYR